MNQIGSRLWRSSSRRRMLTVSIISAMLLVYMFVWGFGIDSVLETLSIWYFTLIGIAGASIANSTGTGGGVVFVPAFSIVQSSTDIVMTTSQIVALSFLIQCFGMTAGSLTWLNKLYADDHDDLDIPLDVFWRVVRLAVYTCLPALLITQFFVRIDAGNLLIAFKSFSILLGVTLLLSVFIGNHGGVRRELSSFDQTALLMMGAAGGVATALFSVGIGEFVALYLFLRGFSLSISVGTAVIITAITVLVGAPGSIILNDIPWMILAMAAPGVVIGGYLGRSIAHALGSKNLKLVASAWIIGSSLFLILSRV